LVLNTADLAGQKLVATSLVLNVTI